MSFGLPPLSLLVQSPQPGPLHETLALLLEPSPLLKNVLAPSVHGALQGAGTRPSSYNELIDLAQSLVEAWDIEQQAEFIACHPRIGATKNLSTFSTKEQVAVDPTPGEVLKRLGTLNTLYEESFPGLRYITWVNGRTRAQIIPEMEGILEISLPPPSPNDAEPRLSEMKKKLRVRITGSKAWRDELKRAVKAVFDIAKDRAGKLDA